MTTDEALQILYAQTWGGEKYYKALEVLTIDLQGLRDCQKKIDDV